MEFSRQQGNFAQWLRQQYERGELSLDEFMEGATSEAVDCTMAFKSCLYMIDEPRLADMFGEAEVRSWRNIVGFGFGVVRGIDMNGFDLRERIVLVRAMGAILRSGGLIVEQVNDTLIIEGQRAAYAPFEAQVEEFVEQMNETLGPDYRPDDDGWSRWMG